MSWTLFLCTLLQSLLWCAFYYQWGYRRGFEAAREDACCSLPPNPLARLFRRRPRVGSPAPVNH